jgi:hypothetical protein
MKTLVEYQKNLEWHVEVPEEEIQDLSEDQDGRVEVVKWYKSL